MKLSIIILNYKTYGLLENCLKSILDNKPSYNFEIIIIDAESDTARLNKVSNIFNNIDIKPIPLKENLGYARANNLGLKKARGEYILISNPDTVVLPGTIDAMIKFMDENYKVGMLGPKVLNPDRSEQNSCFRFPKFMYPWYRRTFLGRSSRGKRWLDWFLMKNFDKRFVKNVDWLLGAFIMARKKAVDEVGFLDERFFLFLEDTDWCWRFWQSGWRVVYFPFAKVIHYPNRASSEQSLWRHFFKKTAWIHLVSWFRFYKKNIFKNKKYHSLN